MRVFVWVVMGLAVAAACGTAAEDPPAADGGATPDLGEREVGAPLDTARVDVADLGEDANPVDPTDVPEDTPEPDAAEPEPCLTFAPEQARLFYDPGGARYAYAPAFVVEEDGSGHLWTCQNAGEGDIRDAIVHTPYADGAPGESRVVLAHGPDGAWDSYHICDPNVVAGRFVQGDTTYGYALFYSGNDIDAINHVQLGVAFSETLADGGDWHRLPTPLVAHAPEPNWGLGQPSAVSLDGAGQILLTYTETQAGPTPHVYVRELDLSDADDPRVGDPRQLDETGILGRDGRRDILTNVDLVWDRSSDDLYVLSERHPFETTAPDFLSASLAVLRTTMTALRAGEEVWHPAAILDAAATGQARHHNAGFARSAAGQVPDVGELTVLFATAAEHAAFPAVMWSVDVWEVRATRAACGTR